LLRSKVFFALRPNAQDLRFFAHASQLSPATEPLHKSGGAKLHPRYERKTGVQSLRLTREKPRQPVAALRACYGFANASQICTPPPQAL